MATTGTICGRRGRGRQRVKIRDSLLSSHGCVSGHQLIHAVDHGMISRAVGRALDDDDSIRPQIFRATCVTRAPR